MPGAKVAGRRKGNNMRLLNEWEGLPRGTRIIAAEPITAPPGHDRWDSEWVEATAEDGQVRNIPARLISVHDDDR